MEKVLLNYLIGICVIIVLSIVAFIVLKIRSNKVKSVSFKKIYRSAFLPGVILVLTVYSLFYFSVAPPGNGFLVIIRKVLILIVILDIGWLCIQAVRFTRKIILERLDLSVPDNLKARKIYTQFRIFENILILIIVLITVSTALLMIEPVRKLGVSLFASAGVAGIIIGFAAQKLIATFLAGVQLAFTQPIRLDDVVIVEKEWGWIEEITLTYVVVRIWDKRRLILPTTYFIEHPFENWTRVTAEILTTVFIYVDFRLPVQEIRDELTRVLKSSKYWDGNVNSLQVTNSTDKTIELRALMSARNSPEAWELKVYVREKLIEFLQKNFPEYLPKTRIDVNTKEINSNK